MNVRLVELDLVPLLPETNPASDNAADKPGQKYNDGFQHFCPSAEAFPPGADRCREVKSISRKHSPKDLTAVKYLPTYPGNRLLAGKARRQPPPCPNSVRLPECGLRSQARRPGSWLSVHTFLPFARLSDSQRSCQFQV